MPTKRQNMLLDLAIREQHILEQVHALEGTIEEKMRQLADLGVFVTYAVIHREYVELAAIGEREALKRALFLQWFEQTEPAFLSGLRNLETGAKSGALVLAEKECSSQSLDDELMWMLPYYYMIADWFIPAIAELPNLVAYCRYRRPTDPVVPPSDLILKRRGQMGDYWESIRRNWLAA